MDLKSPSKNTKKREETVLDDKEKSLSPKSLADEGTEDLRRRFVGDVDLPEGAWFLLRDASVTL